MLDEDSVPPAATRRAVAQFFKTFTADDAFRPGHVDADAVTPDAMRHVLLMLLGGRARGAAAVGQPEVTVQCRLTATGQTIISGRQLHVACLLVAWLVSTHGLHIRACAARAAHQEPRYRKKKCLRLFIVTGGRGRPKAFCSDACKVRAWAWKGFDE